MKNIIAILVIFGIAILALPFINMAKASQYKKCLGIKLSFLTAIFQISKINKWLNMISPSANISFLTYYYVFTKAPRGKLPILNENDFEIYQGKYVYFIGTPITFDEFKTRVEKFLDKPL